MSQGQASHGALFAMEKDGDPPGTFTTIAELNSDLSVGMTRPETEITPHNDGIDYWIIGSVISRQPWTFTLNFIFDDATHDHLTGLQKRFLDNDLFGMRFRGPGSTGPSDEIIGSGQVMNFSQVAPVREGVRSAEVTVRLSGPMKIDGVTIS